MATYPLIKQTLINMLFFLLFFLMLAAARYRDFFRRSQDLNAQKVLDVLFFFQLGDLVFLGHGISSILFWIGKAANPFRYCSALNGSLFKK